MKNLIICLVIFVVAQTMVWLQINGQFVWESFRKYEWLLILFGIPISWLFLEATRHGVAAFDGLLWPQRFLAFACGIVIFSICTWLLKGEGINTKTLISLGLASCLVLIQIFWK
jgi:hypothetical protein|tara:strand:- start:2604 stop:2945 length:342 start_codon:yes stop_codon:yes gene_type:complete